MTLLCMQRLEFEILTNGEADDVVREISVTVLTASSCISVEGGSCQLTRA